MIKAQGWVLGDFISHDATWRWWIVGSLLGSWSWDRNRKKEVVTLDGGDGYSARMGTVIAPR